MKRRWQSHWKKMKCVPVEYTKSSSEYSIEDDVADALLLLSNQPDAQITSNSLTQVCSSDSAGRLDNDLKSIELLPGHPSRSNEKGLPIVYFRKRFRKKENVLIECESDPEKLMWSIGDNGLLKLNPGLIPFREFCTQLSLPCPLLDFHFGSCTAIFSELSLLEQYGKLVSTWHKVYLEMLIVDNEVGSRLFLFEGCLKQAVAYVFVVLTLLCDTNKLGEYVEGQNPICSIRFKLSCVQDLRKQHAFTIYSFSKLKHSNWSYLDSDFQKHCLIAKKLPLPDCTLENIKELNGRTNLRINHLSLESTQGSRKNLKDFIPSGLIKSGKEYGRQDSICSVKHGMLTFALSYNAAPLFFCSLHLKLLMRSNIACVRLWESTLACSMVLRESTCSSTSLSAVPKCCSEIFPQVFPENTPETSLSAERHPKAHLETHPKTANLNGYGMISSQHKRFRTTNTRNSSTLPLGKICSIWQGKRTNDVHTGFGNGPKKPQTEARYIMPSGGSEISSRHKPLYQDSQSFKRIGRAGEKRKSCDTKVSQKNLEILACDSNVLITLGDRCYRKLGMRVVLEFPIQNQWSLAVKFSGSTEYSHKVHHVFQPGSTNCYTHAMMWKGEKDWALEFPDRSQWMLFKEMYEECYNRNFRAAKEVPIPGFHLVEECKAYTKNLPFTLPNSYFQQIENDIDMAMNPSNILYDMDSEDEKWISRNGKSFQTRDTGCYVITEDIFEKCMNMLEKFAYVHHRNHFTVAELEDISDGAVPSEMIISIYHHWQQKRKRTGIPLIRHLQPPSWKSYQMKLQEWNQFTTAKGNSGNMAKAPIVEKPAMFAFCLKPRGLKVPNKRTKCKSQKKVDVAVRIEDQVRDDMASYQRRGKRNWVQQRQDMEFPDRPSQKRHRSELYPGVQDSDEFRMREASGAAKRASCIAVLKRERAQRLHSKADFAINVAASALMIASAIKASYRPTD